MSRKKNPDYLSNKEMLAEVLYCQEQGIQTEKLGKMFMLMAKRYATKPNFSGYSYVDEMINNGIVACCAAVNKFKAEKSDNPFAYFTQCIHTAFIQILNKERVHQEIRDELLMEEDMDPSNSYLERHGGEFKPSDEVVEDEKETEE